MIPQWRYTWYCWAGDLETDWTDMGRQTSRSLFLWSHCWDKVSLHLWLEEQIIWSFIAFSTGGLIALGLASKNWSIDECIWHFESLCNRAFTRRSGTDIRGLSLLVESYHHSRYKTKPLHDALKQAFGENEYLFGGKRKSNTRLKVAVTTTIGGNASIITNYNRSHNEMRKFAEFYKSLRVQELTDNSYQCHIPSRDQISWQQNLSSGKRKLAI